MKRTILCLCILAAWGMAALPALAGAAPGQGDHPPIPPVVLNAFMTSQEVPPGGHTTAAVFLSNLTDRELHLGLGGVLLHRREVVQEFPPRPVILHPFEVLPTPFEIPIPGDARLGLYEARFQARFEDGGLAAEGRTRFVVKHPSPVEAGLHLDGDRVEPGGRIHATLFLRNLTDEELHFALWGGIHHRGDTPFDIPIGPRPAVLAPGEERMVEFDVRIPERAPLGRYAMRVLAGPRPDAPPWTGARAVFFVTPPPPPPR